MLGHEWARTHKMREEENTIKTEAGRPYDIDVKFPLNINPTYCSLHVLWFLSAAAAAAGGRIIVID